jgi:ribosomal protein S18 acetylase RimI-like enzyme
MKAVIEKFNRNRHDSGEVKALLALAVGRPTLDKLAYLIDRFYAPESRKVFVALRGGKIVGIIGIEYSGGSYGFITHLAVRPDLRKKGIARCLIEHATAVLNLSDIEVETDHEAVDFYEACGFQAREIDSPYARYRRFRCIKSIALEIGR